MDHVSTARRRHVHRWMPSFTRVPLPSIVYAQHREAASARGTANRAPSRRRRRRQCQVPPPGGRRARLVAPSPRRVRRFIVDFVNWRRVAVVINCALLSCHLRRRRAILRTAPHGGVFVTSNSTRFRQPSVLITVQ